MKKLGSWKRGKRQDFQTPIDLVLELIMGVFNDAGRCQGQDVQNICAECLWLAYMRSDLVMMRKARSLFVDFGLS